jgi:hypothetical protein
MSEWSAFRPCVAATWGVLQEYGMGVIRQIDMTRTSRPRASMTGGAQALGEDLRPAPPCCSPEKTVSLLFARQMKSFAGV